jgi:hypothetical protein
MGAAVQGATQPVAEEVAPSFVPTLPAAHAVQVVDETAPLAML